MYSKDKLLQAIWQNPDTCTGLHFQYKGGHWETRQRPDGSTDSHPYTILRMAPDGHTIFMNINGAAFASGDIFKLLHYLYATNDKEEVLQRACEAYGIQPEYGGSEEEQERRQRAARRRTEAAIAKEVAQVITAALKDPAKGREARAYLNSRNLQPTERMGAYSTDIQADIIKHLQQVFENMTRADCTAYMRRFFPTIRLDYANNPQGTWVDFIDGYSLLLPYYNGSRIVGFCMRKTTPQPLTWTNKDGEVETMPKYLYSKGMPKGGYCENLTGAKPVILVEGLLDAEAMKQHGFTNIMAVGGQTPTDSPEDAAKSQIQTLQRFGAKHIVYVPDLEYNADGSEKTGATLKTIKNLREYLTGDMYGRGFISLKIAHLPNPTKEPKQDADSVLQEQGTEAMQDAIDGAANWWEWRLLNDIRKHRDNIDDMAAAAVATYCEIANPIEREMLRRALLNAPKGSPLAKLYEAGITAGSLSMIDKNGEATTYRSGITDIIGQLQAAAEKHATAEKIGALLNKAQRIQNHTEAARFAAQVNCTQEQYNTIIAQKPDYIQTCWQLWKWNATKGTYTESRRIGFSPANISIVAAPTSHGKTLFLIQTALYLAQTTRKQYLYISLENDAEQLYIRALSAFIGSKWDASVKNPRKELRDYIKGTDLPADLYTPTTGQRMHIDAEIERYWQEVAPFLHFVRTGSGIDELCSNVAALVEDWQNNGKEVGGIFLDYVQLLHCIGRAYSRTDELKAVCDSLNELAKATGLPIICGSQMNRDATKNNGDKIDGITLANIGESSGIENIAEDCFFLWDTNRIDTADYISGDNFNISKGKRRSRRIFTPADNTRNPAGLTYTADMLRTNCLYVECLKGREHETGGYCILPVNFAAGCIPTDINSSQH